VTLPPLVAILISGAIAGAGLGLGALTRAGTAAAVLVGTAILSGTGWAGLAALGTFFAGSSLVSRLAPDRTAAFDAKGTRRDHWQVLANGGPAALGALIPGAGLWIVTASLAAAAADTWATSTGGWSRRDPRHILSGAPLPPGTSGGVTWMGSLGGLAGALLVALAAALLYEGGERLRLAITGAAIGVGGMLLDSVLGATLQGRFHCDRCDRATERAVHRCGLAARATGGHRWLGNDGVNALACAAAALCGGGAWWLAGG
jgi:uncharacterized protein (TIGR00297 family)